MKVDDGIALTSSDITDQKLTELALRERDERFQALLLHAVDVVCIVDAGGAIRYASPAVERVLGYSTERFCELHPFDLVHPDDLEPCLEQWQTIGGQADSRFTFEVRALHADGGYRWTEVSFRDLRDDPRIEGFVVHFHDVTDRHSAEEALLHQTLHDGLTGLPNRALLLDRLAHALDRALRRESGVAVLFLDVDHFKAVNDSIGHAGGDALLREVAARLRATVRPEDTVARLGGDEFVICCEEITDPDAAVLMADRVREAFVDPVPPRRSRDHGRHEHRRGARRRRHREPRDARSATPTPRCTSPRHAVATVPSSTTTRSGAGCSTISTPRPGSAMRSTRGELVVHWQPAFDLTTDRITSMEALVRWQHAARGLLLPDEFLGAAAIAGLDAPLGTFVLETACAQLAAWDRDGIAPETHLAQPQPEPAHVGGHRRAGARGPRASRHRAGARRLRRRRAGHRRDRPGPPGQRRARRPPRARLPDRDRRLRHRARVTARGAPLRHHRREARPLAGADHRRRRSDAPGADEPGEDARRRRARRGRGDGRPARPDPPGRVRGRDRQPPRAGDGGRGGYGAPARRPRLSANAAEQLVAQVARVDHVVVAQPVGGGVGATELGVLRAAPATSGSIPAASAPLSAGIAPSRAPGNASVVVWPSNGFIAMSDEPKPYALRSVTCSFGPAHRAPGRTYIARREPQDPRLLGDGPGEHARVVGEEDHRQPERPDHLEEARRLLGRVAVDRAGLDRRDCWRRPPPAARRGARAR